MGVETVMSHRQAMFLDNSGSNSSFITAKLYLRTSSHGICVLYLNKEKFALNRLHWHIKPTVQQPKIAMNSDLETRSHLYNAIQNDNMWPLSTYSTTHIHCHPYIHRIYQHFDTVYESSYLATVLASLSITLSWSALCSFFSTNKQILCVLTYSLPKRNEIRKGWSWNGVFVSMGLMSICIMYRTLTMYWPKPKSGTG